MLPLLQPFPMEPGRRAQAWRYQPQYRRPHHFHAEPELNVFLRGSAVVQIGDEVLTVNAGTMIWLPPTLEHSLCSGSPDLEFCVVGFSPELLDAVRREEQRTVDFPRRIQAVAPDLAQRFQDVALAMTAGLTTQAGDCALVKLLREACAADAKPTLGGRAAKLLADEPELSRSSLARKLASNNGDVSRSFRHQLGITFRNYRHRTRILSFLAQLDRGHNMLQSALAAGFGSYSQCHRTFREVLGCSPRDFFAEGVRAELGDRFEPLDCG